MVRRVEWWINRTIISTLKKKCNNIVSRMSDYRRRFGLVIGFTEHLYSSQLQVTITLHKSTDSKIRNIVH
jgi:hypothetical protein